MSGLPLSVTIYEVGLRKGEIKMKKFYLVLAGILLLPVFLTAQTSSCSLMGDANGTGTVDIVDALVVAQAYVGLDPTNYNAECADTDCSGSVDIVDALLIAQLYVGLISSFPCQVTTPAPTPGGSISIACGSSSAVGSFQADQYYSGGSTFNNSNTVDVSQITSNPPPAALFNNERYGALSYTIPGFTSGGTYTVTMYFAETYLTSSGSRVFNVSINGTAVLTNFDIYANAGGQNKAIAQSFAATADGSGQIVIQLTAVTENPKINGISVQSGFIPTDVPTAAPTNSGSYQRGPDPSLASVAATRGTFATAQISLSAGNGFGGGFIYYPTDTSLGTWAAVAICPGYSAKFANEEAWMGPWLASFGFVVIGIETNTTSDGADARATELLAALDYLTQKSTVRDRVDPNRLMVIGHSAGGAGALTAALQRSSLKTVVGLAPGAPGNGLSMANLRMPIMLIGGQNDTTVTPSYINGIWTSISSTTQRAWVELAGNDHLSFTRSNPTEMRVLIPWMKIFLDSDTRYTQFLCPLADSTGISNYRNSCPLVP
jgi:dienelactone hydrolase